FKAQYSSLQDLRKFVCYSAGGHQEVKQRTACSILCSILPTQQRILSPFASGLGFSTIRSGSDSPFHGPKEFSVLGSASGQGQGQKEPTSNSNEHSTPSASIRY
ncbi:hypothetical protein LEMLEM_LOCUS18993, partial [Lemmus lemmus]